MKNKISPSVSAPLLVAAVLVLMSVSELMITGRSGNDQNVYLTAIVVQIIVFVLPSALYYHLRRGRVADPMFMRPVKLSQMVFVLFALLMFVVGMMFIMFLTHIFTDGSASGTDIKLNYFDTEGNTALYAALAFAVVPAVCEELFFRGVVLSEYSTFGSLNAVAVSTVSFAMFHFNPSNIAGYLFSGAVFGFLTVVTRSVWPAVLLHLANNLISLYMSDSFISLMVQEAGSFFVGFVLFTTFALLLLVVLSRAEHIYYKYSAEPPVDTMPPSSREHLSEVYLSPSFFLLVGVFVLAAFLH